MKKVSILVVLLVSLALVLIGVTALAQGNDNQIQPRYSYTTAIGAGLEFSGRTAICEGFVTPTYTDNVSLTVTLYRQNGSDWDYVASWSGSATGGATAGAGGSVTVGTGTYKVTTRGNVGGKEFPTKSITRTK